MNHRIIAQYLLASVVIIGFFCVLSLMLWKDKTGADILVGGLAAAFGSDCRVLLRIVRLCAQGRANRGQS